jgi:hypothetical protein
MFFLGDRAVGCGEVRTASIEMYAHFHAHVRRNIHTEDWGSESDMKIGIGDYGIRMTQKMMRFVPHHILRANIRYVENLKNYEIAEDEGIFVAAILADHGQEFVIPSFDIVDNQGKRVFVINNTDFPVYPSSNKKILVRGILPEGEYSLGHAWWTGYEKAELQHTHIRIDKGVVNYIGHIYVHLIDSYRGYGSFTLRVKNNFSDENELLTEVMRERSLTVVEAIMELEGQKNKDNQLMQKLV